MRGKSFLLLLGLVCLCVLSTSAQIEGQKARLYAAWEVVVNPSKYLAYEGAYIQLVKIYSEHMFPYTCYVYREDDFHYWFCMPIDNYEALDDISSHLKRIEKEVGNDYQILKKRMSSYCDSVNTGTVKVRWDLTYIPKEPRVNYEDWNFF